LAGSFQTRTGVPFAARDLPRRRARYHERGDSRPLEGPRGTGAADHPPHQPWV